MRPVVVLLLLTLAACAVKVRTLQVEPVTATGDDSFVVRSAVKAHLVDGSVVVFEDGISVLNGRIIGDGLHYDLLLRQQEPVTEIPLERIAAMESFQTPVNEGATAVASTGATAGSGLAGLAVLKAIFGSCPTTYSLEDGEPLLEAESFSYSIAPGFEYRDIDRLGIRGAPGAPVELEIRNEALETHYINQVELLAVAHSADERVYPDPEGQPLVVRNLKPALIATDNAGRRVDAEVAAADGASWRASGERLAAVTAQDFEDYVVLEFDGRAGVQQALVLRLRNSLLNTVLLYEVMLAGQGFRALDWMGQDLSGLWARYRLARWYRGTMGLRVDVQEGRRWRPVARIDDTGPIAWKDVAVELPRSRSGRHVVRLSFVSDNWRIDRAALAEVSGRPTYLRLPLAEIRDAFDARHPGAERNLDARDDRYVITYPGEHLAFRFDTGGLDPARAHTYFLAATGYYIEWMRRDWLQTTSAQAFEPGDEAVVDALQRWRSQRETLRAQFDATRINVR